MGHRSEVCSGHRLYYRREAGRRARRLDGEQGPVAEEAKMSCVPLSVPPRHFASTLAAMLVAAVFWPEPTRLRAQCTLSDVDHVVVQPWSTFMSGASSLAMDDDLVVIGDVRDRERCDGGSGWCYPGAIHVYQRNWSRWAHQAKLYSPQFDVYEQFGAAVAISGNTIVVNGNGNLGPSSNGGCAYVLVCQGDAWSHQATFTPSDVGPMDAFGAALGIDGDTAVVGAPLQGFAACPPPCSSGAAYVFVREGETWSQQAKLVDPVPSGHLSFGSRIALDGDTLLVQFEDRETCSHPLPVGQYCDYGVYVFVRRGSSWAFQDRLIPLDPTLNDYYGSSGFALRGDLAVVGAPHDVSPCPASPPNQPPTGAVYVFRRFGDSWSQEAKLVASPPRCSGQFGSSVALSSDGLLLVGSEGVQYGEISNGALYVFRKTNTGWTECDRRDGLNLPPDVSGRILGGAMAAENGVAASQLQGGSSQSAGGSALAAFWELRCIGACCTGRGCAEITESECKSAGGEFAGVGVACETSQCDIDWCHGDFNQDGRFDALDIKGIVDALLRGEDCKQVN